MEHVEYDVETNFNSSEFHIWLKTTKEFHFEKDSIQQKYRKGLMFSVAIKDWGTKVLKVIATNEHKISLEWDNQTQFDKKKTRLSL